jgi:PAS domain S-box-containing protein
MLSFGSTPDPTSSPRSAPPIRIWLVALSVLTVLPAALMVLGLEIFQYREGRADAEANTRATARALAEAVDRQVGEVQAGLRALATSRRLQQGDFAEFHQQAREYLRLEPLALNVVVIDSHGAQKLNTLLPYGDPLPASLVAATQLQDVFVTGRPVVTDVFMGPVHGQPLVAVGVPSFLQDEVAYSVNAGMEPRRLQEILVRQQLPAEWIVAILDGAGSIVARSIDHDRFVGQKAGSDLRERSQRADEGSFEGVSKEGTPVLAVFSRARTTGWTVAIGIPSQDLMAPLHRTLTVLAVATLVLLAASATFAWQIGAVVARSIEHLVSASVQLGRGERVQVPQLAFEEANARAQAMGHASETLRNAHADLARHEARLSALLESAHDAIVMVDDGDHIVVFNAAASALFGHYKEEALGLPLAALFTADFEPLRADAVREVWLGGGPVALDERAQDLRGRRRDGSEFPMVADLSAAQAGNNRFLVLVAQPRTEVRPV